MLYLVLGTLPWLPIIDMNDISFITKLGKILKMRNSISVEMLCKGLPEEFTYYLNYCKILEFEQDPNYDYLRSLFKIILDRNYQNIELNFFWTIKEKNKKVELKSFERIGSFKRKKSSQKILYNKIKKSLEKHREKKCNNNDKNNNNNSNKILLEQRDAFEISSLNKNKNNNNNFKPENKTEYKKFEPLAPNKFNSFFKIKINDNEFLNDGESSSITNKTDDLKYTSKFDSSIINQTVNQQNNYNIIVGNNIDYKKINIININNKNKIKQKNINNNIDNKKFIMLNNSYKTKNKIINILNNKDRIINNHTYRTLNERERERAETSKSKNKYNRNIYNKYILNKNINRRANSICTNNINSCFIKKNNELKDRNIGKNIIYLERKISKNILLKNNNKNNDVYNLDINNSKYNNITFGENSSKILLKNN